MKSKRPTRPPNAITRATLLVFAVALLAGCQTVQEHRARQMREWRGTLGPEVWERALSGEVAKDDSSATVYIALGTPQYTFLEPSTSETQVHGQAASLGERWIWVYWGFIPDVENASTTSGEPPRIYTRAETRWPGLGEKRSELRLSFEEDHLVAWEIGPIRVDAAEEREMLQLGTFPRLKETSAQKTTPPAQR